jgi:GGDEF domain-containing protein
MRWWSSRHGSRLATVGLAVVLILLAGFSLWAALRINAAVRQVDRDSAEQREWQTARLELATGEAALHAFVVQARPEYRAEIMRAAVALRIALNFLERHADPEDVGDARQAGVDHQRYQAATGRLLAAVAAGDAARARAIDAREVQPSFALLADRLAEGALEQDQVTTRLAALRRLGETLVVAAPLVFTVGLSLLIGCWLLLLGYQRRIRQQALSDALTGLPNRTLLLDRTAQAIRQADRELVPAALLLLDLDRFKEVNDTLGHHCGDQLLVQVGQRLRARGAGRLGGRAPLTRRWPERAGG